MGYEKIITLAQKCTKYAQACGKQSILETIPIGKVDASKLGVCLSDGKIRFQTEEAALNYAKNVCMKTANLPPSQQFEIGVVREGNTILGISNGTRIYCDLSNIDYFSFENRKMRAGRPKTVSVEHYHPDLYGKGKTNPLSINTYRGDTGTLEGGGLKSITAYNSLGQYNKAEALPNFNQKILLEFCEKHQELMKRAAIPQNVLERFSLLDSIRKLSAKTNFKISNKNMKECDDLKLQIHRLYRKFQETAEYAKLTHEFWIKNAEKYGMKYTTNMTF